MLPLIGKDHFVLKQIILRNFVILTEPKTNTLKYMKLNILMLIN